jgi:hypothetical protein
MRIKRRWLVGMAVGAGIACGGDGGTGPSPETLVGTWGATKAEFVSVASPSTKVDLVAMSGTVQLVLTAAKTFTLTVTVPGAPDEVSAGTWSSSDILSLTFTSGHAGTMQFQLNLSGNTMTLSGADAEFDFNQDGVDEPAKLNLVLQRVP